MKTLVAAFVVLLVSVAHAEPPVRFAEAGEVAPEIEHAAVLDLRPFSEYLRGHLPGAVHIDDECLRAPMGGHPVRYCPPERLAELFGAAGVSSDIPVIVYASQEDPLAATMAAYALARLGHADVTILSGGFNAWAANHPVTKAFPAVEPRTLELRQPLLGATEFEEFQASIGFNDVVFIDARPANQHRGDVPIWSRNGHIPGAHSLDWTTLTLPDNKHRLRPIDEIEAMLDDLGVSAWDDVVVYCGTGREATLLMIALSCELGWKGVRLYEGSWTDYVTRHDAPIETGPRVEPRTRIFGDGPVRLSGQPTEQTFAWLAEQGVRTVISCRTDIEMDRLDFDQERLLEDLDINYVHIPMGGHWEYSPAQVKAFANAMSRSEGDVLLHCASGGRARLLWMAHLVEHNGVSPDEAWEQSMSLGGTPWSFGRLLDGRVNVSLDEH